MWGGATSSHLNSLGSIQATRLPLGAVNLLGMHIIPPLTINAGTHFTYPQRNGGLSQPQPHWVTSGYWTWDLSHDSPLLYQLSYLSYVDTLLVKPRQRCDWARKDSANLVWVNSLTWCPITTWESLSLIPTKDSEWTLQSGGTLPGKDSPYLVGKAEVLGDSAEPPKQYAPSYWWNAWGTAEWVVWKLPLIEVVERAATQCSWQANGPWIITKRHICLPHVYSEGLWCCKLLCMSPLVNTTARWEIESKNHNRHQHVTYELVGGSTLKEKTHLRRTHGIVGICLIRHLGTEVVVAVA